MEAGWSVARLSKVGAASRRFHPISLVPGRKSMKNWAWAVLGCSILVGCNEECPTKGKPEMKPESTTSAAVSGTPVTLAVKEMMCAEGCAKRVEEILASSPGVKSATVDFAGKQANLVVESSTFDSARAVADLKSAGYPAEVVSASP
jgi:copper chaperone CopZ